MYSDNLIAIGVGDMEDDWWASGGIGWSVPALNKEAVAGEFGCINTGDLQIIKNLYTTVVEICNLLKDYVLP